MKRATTKRIRRSTHRIHNYQRKPNKQLDALANKQLRRAQEILDEARSLDTAIRDVIAEGLARIVFVAYDTKATALAIDDLDWFEFIQSNTHQWFRERGFVEWFSAGAAVLFNTSLPGSVLRMNKNR